MITNNTQISEFIKAFNIGPMIAPLHTMLLRINRIVFDYDVLKRCVVVGDCNTNLIGFNRKAFKVDIAAIDRYRLDLRVSKAFEGD